MSVVVTDNTNFFWLTLELQRLASEEPGINLRIYLSPGSALDSVGFQVFVTNACRLMREGKLTLIVQEDERSAFDSELPAHFIQPAA
jgi:hypothetical protein